MKLISFRTADGRRGVGVMTDDGVRVLAADDPDGVPGLSPLRRLLDANDGDLSAVSLTGAALLDPAGVMLEAVVPDPGKIVAAPVNYADHKAEMSSDHQIDSLGVFLKAPSSVIPHGGTVRLPYTDRRFDQEGELAVVIGRRASHVPVEKALDHVAGYTSLLDITMRGGEDRSTRKSFDTFTPVGPALVTADEAELPERMELRCWVNDELRQDARIADLIWGVPQLIAYASSVMVLEPGDVVTTGTPAGVGPLRGGDRIAVAITGLDRLEVTVTADGAVPSPTGGAASGPQPPAA